MAREYEGRVAFIGIAWRDTEAAARAFVREFDIPYPNGLDHDDSIFRLFGFNYQPNKVLVTRAGAIFDRQVGPISREQLDEKLRALLAER